jgi:hypothetical protein
MDARASVDAVPNETQLAEQPARNLDPIGNFMRASLAAGQRAASRRFDSGVHSALLDSGDGNIVKPPFPCSGDGQTTISVGDNPMGDHAGHGVDSSNADNAGASLEYARPCPIISGPRCGLTEPRAIIALMAQDLNDLRREHCFAGFEALVDCGWSRRQITQFQMEARELAARAWSETRAPDDERITVASQWGIDPAHPRGDATGVFDRSSPQAKPFVAFDAVMRENLARFEGNRHAPHIEGEA